MAQARSDGDVFLSLAQYDDDGENDSFEDAREDRESVKAKTPTIPGGFPQPTSPRLLNERPHSSGQLLSRRLEDLVATASEGKHARHISQLDQPYGLAVDSGIGFDKRPSTQYSVSSSKPELLTRARLENLRELDGRTEYTSYARHRKSHSVHPLSNVTRLRGSNEEEVGRSFEHSMAAADTHEYMPTSAGAGVSPPGSDSLESQTAPSTVWDELDDLKSRIKKLESGGGLTSISPRNPSRLNTDRPRTATTAPTTISFSPVQARETGVAASEVTIEGATDSNALVLLHNALSKAKETLTPQLYRPLEATATDVLALASMTAGGDSRATNFSGASVVNNGTVSDRQLKRKVDSMCRNLTDLCIALCDAQSDGRQIQSSPLSARKLHLGTPPYSRTVHRSAEPEEDVVSRTAIDARRSSSFRKSLGRLEDFRSARGLSPRMSGSSPDSYQDAGRSPVSIAKDYTARYTSNGRPESRAISSRQHDEARLDPTIRAPSRAMTDVGPLKQAPSQKRQLFSGEIAQRSPSLRETLAARRASAGIRDYDNAGEVGGPSVSLQTPGLRRLSDRPKAPPSEIGSSVSTTRRRVASMEPYSPSFRTGHLPIRTSSLSQRHMAES